MPEVREIEVEGFRSAGLRRAVAASAAQAGNRRRNGTALDLGCGTGHWSIEMARRGWDVTGIDIVPAAIRGARARAWEAGADVRFLEGDATALQTAAGSGFSFVWDFGTVHGLTPSQRKAVGRTVTDEQPFDATGLPPQLKHVDPRCYRLRRS